MTEESESIGLEAEIDGLFLENTEELQNENNGLNFFSARRNILAEKRSSSKSGSPAKKVITTKMKTRFDLKRKKI